MSSNVKIVNIKAPVPVRNVTPPVYGIKNNIKMTHSDILKCLCRRAAVYEVLPDGTTVRLTTKNFRDDHSHLMKNPVPNSALKENSIIDPDIDEDDAMEPDESDIVMEERTYMDGITRNVIVGSCPKHTDPEDGCEDCVHTHDNISNNSNPSKKEVTHKEVTKSGKNHRKK